MQTKPTKKPLILLLLLLVLLGEMTYAMTQSGYLLGILRSGSFTFDDSVGLNPPEGPGTGMFYINAADGVEVFANEVAGYAADAEAAEAKAATAAESGDSDALEVAVSEAQTAADNAQESYDQMASYLSRAESTSESAAQELTDGIAEEAASKEVIESAQTDYENIAERAPDSDWSATFELQDDYDACVDEYGPAGAMMSCSSQEGTYDQAKWDICVDYYNVNSTTYCGIMFTMYNSSSDFEDIYSNARAYYDTWQTAQANYDSEYPSNYLTELQATATEKAEDLARAETAAAAAAADLEAAQNAAENAAKYGILTCTSLTIDPSSYEMLASDTEASFDFSVKITTGEKRSALDLDSGNFTPVSLPRVITNTYDYWSGTLVVEAHSQDGGLTYNSDTNTRFEINLTEPDTLNFTFSGGKAGDTIDIYIDGQKVRCSETIQITQATAVPPIETDDDDVVIIEQDTGSLDSDADGLTNDEEANYGTDANDSDSDNDTYSDGDEVDAGTDPLDANDYPGVVAVVVEDPVEPSDEVPTLTRDIILADYTCTDSFMDTEGEWHQDIICRAKEAGWVKGYSTVIFGPDGDITRAEYVKVLTKIFGLDEDDGYDGKVGFNDVTSTDWYYPYVNLAENEDWIRTRDAGYNFRPNEAITRADAILWAIRAADQSTYTYDVEDTFSDVENDDYFAYALAIANSTLVDTAEETNQPVVEGYTDGTFGPYQNIARSEAMAIATRVAIAWGVASEDWDD